MLEFLLLILFAILEMLIVYLFGKATISTNMAYKRHVKAKQTENKNKLYKRITFNYLNHTPDEELVTAVLHNIWYKLEKGQEENYDALHTFSIPQKIILTISFFLENFESGGFSKACAKFNREDYPINASYAFEAIKGDEFSELIANAKVACDFLYPSEEIYLSAYEFSVEKHKDSLLTDLNNEFSELNKIVNIEKLCIEYIRKNLSYFCDGIVPQKIVPQSPIIHEIEPKAQKTFKRRTAVIK